MARESRVTFSIRVGGPTARMTELAVLAESVGFDQIWTGNDLFGEPGLVSLPMMLNATSTIRVGSAVIDPVTIHPVQLAQYASGLQSLSDNRFLLGVGAGSRVFFDLAAVEYRSPLQRTREALVAIRALTQGKSPADVEGAGAGWHSQALLRKPAEVPLYLGAMGPKMLEMAGRCADGALPLCLPPRQVLDAMAQLDVGAREVGKTVADLDVAACLWCAIDDDPGTARRMLAEHIATYSGSLPVSVIEKHGLDPEEFARTQQLILDGRRDDAVQSVLTSSNMLELGIAGGVGDVVDQCAELLDSGVRHLSFGPPLGGRDLTTALTLLGRRAIDELRRQY